jgi:ADP-dependent phosphofructokinase/glucokinase
MNYQVRPDSRVSEALQARLGPTTSLGLSLSELFMLAGSRGNPGRLAQQVASQYGARRVIVHADHWALTVHRGDPEHQQRVLLAGNAFAAARARNGQPTAVLYPAEEAIYTDDLPPSGALDDGWQATCVPAPHLRRPAGTVGLGDTFTAGVLLAESLSLLSA